MYNNRPVTACPFCMTAKCNKLSHRLVKFDSTGEYKRWCYLKEAKWAKDLELKPELSLYAYRPHLFRGSRGYIGIITPDYSYYDTRIKKTVVEDYKGGADLPDLFKYRWKILGFNYPKYELRISNKFNDFSDSVKK